MKHDRSYSEIIPENIPLLQSLVLRLVMGAGLLVVAIVVVNTIWSIGYERRQIINDSRNNTLAIGITLAPHLDTDGLLEFTNNQSASDPRFLNIRNQLKQVQLDNHFSEEQLYVLTKDTTQENIYQFSLMLQEQTFIGDAYSPPKSVQDLYEKAWAGLPQSTPVFSDDNGTFIGALIPLFNTEGEVVGILELDRNLDNYLKEFWEEISIPILIDILFFIIWLVLGVWMYRIARKKVDNLLQGTIAIREENYDFRIPLNSNTSDEFSLLARALNMSLGQLGERFAMLKFLPKHTLKMIEFANEQQSKVELNMIRNIDCVIMETDIRGFTALTERMTPRNTIRLVNEFIEVQAEIIIKEEYNGSIDKYMGDAVLVIFEGEGMERRAYECAHHIQFSIRKLNRTKAKIAENLDISYKPVEIGIGLSKGRVIMGNMGCEERMEHTVIGATVNLAARLSSVAQPGEIVIHQPILESINKTGLYEEIEVKGFSKPVPIRRITRKATEKNLTFCSGIDPKDLKQVTSS